MTVNEPAGWRCDGRRAQVAGHDRLELGDVERRVNPEGLREFKVYSSWVIDTLDFEGPDEMGRQLSGLHVEWNVFGVEPNLLARLMHWSRNPPPVSQSLVLFSSA